MRGNRTAFSGNHRKENYPVLSAHSLSKLLPKATRHKAGGPRRFTAITTAFLRSKGSLPRAAKKTTSPKVNSSADLPFSLIRRTTRIREVMTFAVTQDGIVYEKDLGPDT